MYEASKGLLWCPNVDKPSIGDARLDANNGGDTNHYLSSIFVRVRLDSCE